MAINDYDPLIQGAASQYKVDPQLLKSIMTVESNGDPNALGPPVRLADGSVVRAAGLMQFLPSTAKQYGVDPFNPQSAIPGAARYVSDLLTQYGNPAAALEHYSGWAPGYAGKILAAYRSVPAPSASAPASSSPQGGPSPQLPPDEVTLLSGKPQPATSTPSGAVPAPASAPSGPQLPPEERQLYAPPPQPKAAPPPAPPAPPPPAAVPTGPVPAPIYQAPTTPLIRPGGDTSGLSADVQQQIAQAQGPMPAPTGVAGPVITPEQQQAAAGFSHGARQAVNPLLEFLSNTGNRLADVVGPSMNWLRTNRPALDAASEAQFQQQYGQSPLAQGAAAGTRYGLPFVMGGATSAAAKLVLEAMSLPELAAFVTGTGGAGQAGWRGLVTRALSGGTTGAIQGGITGGGPGMATGAGLGGTVLPALGGALDWVGNRFGDAARGALVKIAQAMTRDGMTTQQAETALQQLGQHGILADLDDQAPNLVRLAEGVANAPGPGQAAARKFLSDRASMQPSQLNDAVRIATGTQPGQSAFGTLADLAQARSAAAAPLYKALDNVTVSPAQAAQLDRFVNTPIGKRAINTAVAKLQLDSVATNTPLDLAAHGITQNADGSYSLIPGSQNLGAYDILKRGYDGLVEPARDIVTGRLDLSKAANVPGMPADVSVGDINGVRASLVQELRGMFPQYAKALDAWAGPSAAMDAINQGRDVLTTDPEQTASILAKLNPSEKQMYNVGVAQALKDTINKTPDSADATRRIFGNQFKRDQIAASFGGANTPEFQNFQNEMERQATFAATNRRMFGGSPTAGRTTAIQEAQAPSPAGQAANALMTIATHGVHPVGLGMQAANALVTRAAAPSERLNQALGNMLFNPAQGQQVLSTLQGGMPQSMRDILMGWRGQQLGQLAANARSRLTGPPQQEPLP